MLEIPQKISLEGVALLESVPARGWFHRLRFLNFTAPPSSWGPNIEENFDRKRRLITPWLSVVEGQRVLDLFCANGGFSLLALQHGAISVTGIEQDELRLQAARATWTALGHSPDFIFGDVYDTPNKIDMRGDRNLRHWFYSIGAVERIIKDASFTIRESVVPAPEEQKRFPWYAALLQVK